MANRNQLPLVGHRPLLPAPNPRNTSDGFLQGSSADGANGTDGVPSKSSGKSMKRFKGDRSGVPAMPKKEEQGGHNLLPFWTYSNHQSVMVNDQYARLAIQRGLTVNAFTTPLATNDAHHPSRRELMLANARFVISKLSSRPCVRTQRPSTWSESDWSQTTSVLLMSLPRHSVLVSEPLEQGRRKLWEMQSLPRAPVSLDIMPSTAHHTTTQVS